MDFFGTLNTKSYAQDFGTQRLVLSSKASVFALNRPHTSISMVSENSKEMTKNQATFCSPSDSRFRYILVKELTFDLFATIYDFNTNNAFVLRTSAPLGAAELAAIKTVISKWKNSNLEMRAIGMQNGGHSLFSVVEQLRRASNANLIEADMFGNMKRHLAFDIKTGVCYDLLLLDRIYRAAELINEGTFEEMIKRSSKFKFI